MEIKLPNFLIVGAAKSGTTSIYYYLKQHPQIFMCPAKEPRFITSQFVKFPFKGIYDYRTERNIIKNFDEYKNLFSEVKNETAIGEASVDNLYFYEDAIKYIKKYLGDVKIIIILRNPIERAFSQYSMFAGRFREYLSFEEALNAEDERKGENWAFGWHYKSVGFYYKQVKAYLENFSQVKVYLYDDLKDNSLNLIKDMYEFLEVDSSFVPDVNLKTNIGGVPKNKFIHGLLTKPHRLKSILRQILQFLALEERFLNLINRWKDKNVKKIKLKPETREYLKNLYREDILNLQSLINRDLSHWLK